MKFEQLIGLTSDGNGAMKLRQLQRLGEFSAEQLEHRAQAAANWLRGYARYLADIPLRLPGLVQHLEQPFIS